MVEKAFLRAPRPRRVAELRYPRQHAHTIHVRAPVAAMDALWREFRALSARLRRELEEVTERAIRGAVFAGTGAPFHR